MVPFMFVGFDIIPQAAEEIDLPYRDIGTALILSVIMAIAWYTLIIIGVGLVMSSEALATADLVTAEANSMIYGEMGETVLLVTGLAGIVTSWNALIVGASRAPMPWQRRACSRSAGQSPSRYHTPKNAILLIGALSVISPFLVGRHWFGWLMQAGSASFWLCLRCIVISGAAQK